MTMAGAELDTANDEKSRGFVEYKGASVQFYPRMPLPPQHFQGRHQTLVIPVLALSAKAEQGQQIHCQKVNFQSTCYCCR